MFPQSLGLLMVYLRTITFAYAVSTAVSPNITEATDICKHV